jgi:mono/diheme cytochrome c family protein
MSWRFPLRIAMVWLSLTILPIESWQWLQAADELQPIEETREFMQTYCGECHAGGASEGSFELESLTDELADSNQLQRWVLVHDRVAEGEMPPPDARQPSDREADAFLKQLGSTLTTADLSTREVVLRRLNREEYQNTLRDLLGIETDLRELLPEDQAAGGFDNNGQALSLSTEVMQRYLQAAEIAIDEVIEIGDKPVPQTFVADSLHEVERYIPKEYKLDGDRVVTFKSNPTQYSKISTRSKKLPVAGRYRYQFQAATVNTDQPLIFSVVASDFKNVAAIYRSLGYFEADDQVRDYTIEATLDENFAIQFFALGLPGWVNDIEDGKHPGVGFGPVTITGPLVEHWPPQNYSQLIGDVNLEQGTLDDAGKVLRSFMERAFRRPITAEEFERYLGLVRQRGKAQRSFKNSLRAALIAVLCSPNFLYLRETNSPSATTVQTISDYELASRLSYFLWNSMPDAQLLNHAADETLHNRDILRQQVQRMLSDEKSQRFQRNFVAQWLHLREINDTTPDQKLFPEFDDFLQASMVNETESFFREVLEHDLSILNFVDSDFAMLNRRLAAHYGIEQTQDMQGVAMSRVQLPAESVRGGVMTQAAVLKVTANGTNTSPVTRGVFVLENIIGKPTRPPPASVAAIEPDIRGTTTIREKLEKHRSQESCAGCHRHIDPPGFALESFDPIGRFREEYLQFKVNPQFIEQGWGKVEPVAKVNARGMTDTGVEFDGIREFKQLLLKDKDQFAVAFTRKMTAYALGRELGFSDRNEIARIAVSSADQGYGLKSLIHEIVQSPIFRSP